MNRRKCLLFFVLVYFSGYLLAARDYHEANEPASFLASTFTAFGGIQQAAARAGERRRHVVMVTEPKVEQETSKL
jgi:hypothetical protein